MLKPEVLGRRLAKLRRLGFERCVSLGDYKVEGLRVLGRGHSSIVFAAEFRDLGVVAVKTLRTDSKRDSLLQECDLIRRAYPVAPEIYSCDDEFIVMELVRGVKLGDLVKNTIECRILIPLYIKILAASRYLDMKEVTHKELNVLKKHVLVEETHKVRVIDFESGFMGFTCNVCRVFSTLFIKDVHVKMCCDLGSPPTQAFLEMLRRYKKTNSSDLFIELIKAISSKCLSNSCRCVS